MSRWRPPQRENAPRVQLQQQHNANGVPKWIAEQAYIEYELQFGSQQSFERLHKRGGSRMNGSAWFLAALWAATMMLVLLYRHEVRKWQQLFYELLAEAKRAAELKAKGKP